MPNEKPKCHISGHASTHDLTAPMELNYGFNEQLILEVMLNNYKLLIEGKGGMALGKGVCCPI